MRPATAERSHPIPTSKLKTVGNIYILYKVVPILSMCVVIIIDMSLWPSINNNILFVVNHALCCNNVVQLNSSLLVRCIGVVKV